MKNDISLIEVCKPSLATFLHFYNGGILENVVLANVAGVSNPCPSAGQFVQGLKTPATAGACFAFATPTAKEESDEVKDVG